MIYKRNGKIEKKEEKKNDTTQIYIPELEKRDEQASHLTLLAH